MYKIFYKKSTIISFIIICILSFTVFWFFTSFISIGAGYAGFPFIFSKWATSNPPQSYFSITFLILDLLIYYIVSLIISYFISFIKTKQ